MNRNHRITRKGILVVVSLVLVVSAILLLSLRNHPPEGEAVVISYLGHTNVSTSARPFALFMISNQWSRPVRWSGDWTEVDGMSDFTARIANPSLPANFPSLSLKGGDSFIWGVGQPDGDAQTRWRLTLQYREHTWGSRWIDWSLRNKHVPVKIGPLVLVDAQKILSQSNQLRSSSAWVPWKSGAEPAK